MAKISNRTLNLEEVFDIDTEALETELFAEDDRERMVEITGAFIRNLLPQKDEKVEKINQIVDCVIAKNRLSELNNLQIVLTLGNELFKECSIAISASVPSG